jgi:response regulator RpfG family c-di-GMP phosphodiesterase
MDQRISILYVDDEPINLMLFSLNFKSKYNIITALSGMEGLTKLKENSAVSIVISDMRMPGMNGIEFIRRAKKEFPSIKYYILTGFDITEEIAEALSQKLICKYFNKPFNIEEIDKSIIEAMQ